MFKVDPSLANKHEVMCQMVSYAIGRTEATRIAAMRSTREEIENALTADQNADQNADVSVLKARYNELMCA
jgi:hypothetical protein